MPKWVSCPCSLACGLWFWHKHVWADLAVRRFGSLWLIYSFILLLPVWTAEFPRMVMACRLSSYLSVWHFYIRPTCTVVSQCSRIILSKIIQIFKIFYLIKRNSFCLFYQANMGSETAHRLEIHQQTTQQPRLQLINLPEASVALVAPFRHLG